MEAGATAHVGCSGYVYGHWQGVFYPDDLSRNRWFEHYALHFDTVEINNTFYTLPEADTFDAWRERAPRGFQYALKLSRYGTHMKHLKDPQEWLGRFLERAERLGASLGPILVQLPPHWHADPDRLSRFLAIAPVRHRWAIEFRDESWLCDEICDILREHGAALCLHDLVDDHPRVVTADWVYLRFHGAGSEGRYTGSYSYQALTALAKRIREHLSNGLDVFAYFNNDQHGHAVHNARDLRRYVGADDA